MPSLADMIAAKKAADKANVAKVPVVDRVASEPVKPAAPNVLAVQAKPAANPLLAKLQEKTNGASGNTSGSNKVGILASAVSGSNKPPIISGTPGGTVAKVSVAVAAAPKASAVVLSQKTSSQNSGQGTVVESQHRNLHNGNVEPNKSTGEIAVSSVSTSTSTGTEVPNANGLTQKEVDNFRGYMDSLHKSFEFPEMVGQMLGQVLANVQADKRTVGLLKPEDFGAMVRALRNAYGTAVTKASEKSTKRSTLNSKVSKVEDLLGTMFG